MLERPSFVLPPSFVRFQSPIPTSGWRMYGLPFPEASPEHAEASTSEQLLLRKEVAQRFGHSGTYRDLPFAVRHGLASQG